MTSVERIKERVKHLHERIERLRIFQKTPQNDYLTDWFLQDAVERNFQVAIECCTDIAAYLIAVHGLKQPAERRGVFHVLSQAGWLDEDFADTMAQAVSLRNRLVHLYTTVEADKMYHYLQNDLAHFERFEAFALAAIDQIRTE